MNNITFLKLIKNFRLGEMEAFTEIYNCYKKTIKCYSSKIGDEDSAQELTVFLLELIYNIDTDLFLPDLSDGIRRYITVCLKNKYIALLKKNQAYCMRINELDEAKLFCPNNADSNFFIKECLKFLPIKQKIVILYRYVYNYQDKEIAAMLNITTQAVGRLRNRALETLRRKYEYI